MKPVIAITCDYDYESGTNKLHEDYHKAISIFGGLPMLLPGNNSIDISIILGLADGILITGGDDIDPFFYEELSHVKLGIVNPYRDKFELELARRAIEAGKPVLGICRGAQVINVAMGGTLYQDIESQLANPPIAHMQKAPKGYGMHEVILKEESNLYKILGQESIRVNSFHHQAIRQVAPGFRSIGYAPDGVIEAIEKIDHPFTIGLQWHPEKMIQNYNHAKRVFREFIKNVEKF